MPLCYVPVATQTCRLMLDLDPKVALLKSNTVFSGISVKVWPGFGKVDKVVRIHPFGRNGKEYSVPSKEALLYSCFTDSKATLHSSSVVTYSAFTSEHNVPGLANQ